MLVSTHMYSWVCVWISEILRCVHMCFFSLPLQIPPTLVSSVDLPVRQHICSLSTDFSVRNTLGFPAQEKELIAGFHILKEKKMFRLGGISLIREMQFAEKNEWQKKKIPISLLAGNSERKLWELMKSFVLDYEIFLYRCLSHLAWCMVTGTCNCICWSRARDWTSKAVS